MTVCFLGLFVNGRYHTACRYSGPVVSNSASIAFFFFKICYYGRQWDLIWCNDPFRFGVHGSREANEVCKMCCVDNIPRVS